MSLDDFATYFSNLKSSFPILMAGAMTVAAALLILIFGWTLAKILKRTLSKPSFAGGRLDPTLRPVLASTIFYVIIAMTLYAVLIKLGVPPESLLAVFGAAGLAIGLALKDTLSNIAAGVMMLTLRPLQVGEFIDTPHAAGTVTEIGLFATTVKNSEGIFIYVPNRQMWVTRVQNFGRHSERKLIVDIGVGYDTDLKAAQTLILGVLRNLPDVKAVPTSPECHVMSFGDSAITLSCRAWLPADDWLSRSSDARIAIKDALDGAGIDIPFPQRVVRIKES